LDLLRNRSVTPSNSLMTRSAYVPSSNFSDYNSRSENSRSKSKTPQLSRRSSSRSAYGRESTSPYSWQSFQPVVRPSAYHPLTSDRAEPDGIENDDDYQAQKHKDSLEGAYDHSKEYDPFKTAERQMQELLFGPSSTSSSSQPSAAGRAPMQKPQPVRPSSTSAFSAYVPARGLGATSPTKPHNASYDSSPDSPPRSFSSAYSKPSYSYSSSPSKTTRDFQSLNRQSPPKISGTLTRPTALSLMTAPDYNPGKGENLGAGLGRQGSLRASAARGNWKELFPSLSRQPGQPAAAAAAAPEASSGQQQSALARFRHECGNPFSNAPCSLLL
jgi:hypothetical protein